MEEYQTKGYQMEGYQISRSQFNGDMKTDIMVIFTNG